MHFRARDKKGENEKGGARRRIKTEEEDEEDEKEEGKRDPLFYRLHFRFLDDVAATTIR